MKYALFNNQRIIPTKNVNEAICPICGEVVIPKCGKIKIHHWAHKTSQNCDPWWENETEWHRKWKEHFPEDFQEYLMIDSNTGEKHIADIRTNKGFVIEFQHSSIKYEERQAREIFYKNMVWVVDAKKYYDKFKQALSSNSLLHCKTNKNYFYIKENYYDNKVNFLPRTWLESSVPVLFDFGVNDIINNDFDKQKGWLYCIFPEKYYEKYGFGTSYCGIYLRKEVFINKIVTENYFYPNIVLQELEINEQAAQIQRHKWEQEQLKQQREYHKKLLQTKYVNEKSWRNAIHDIRLAFENNIFKPLKIYITDDGKITDYSKKNIYNYSDFMILGTKSYEDIYKEKTYTENELLLLIKYNERFIPALTTMPNNLLYILLDMKINFYIMKLDIIEYYSKYKIFPSDFDRIYSDFNVKNDLNYIFENFKQNRQS